MKKTRWFFIGLIILLFAGLVVLLWPQWEQPRYLKFEEFYFEKGNSLPGASVVETLRTFKDKFIIMAVKTKASEKEIIYNWDGFRTIATYQEEDPSAAAYINPLALFWVHVEKNEDRTIWKVSFYQEED